jgi:hypothetical protein
MLPPHSVPLRPDQRPRQRGRRRRRVSVIAAVAGLIMLPGCAGTRSPAGGSPGVTSLSVAPAAPPSQSAPRYDTTGPVDAAAVESSYLRFWAVASTVDGMPVSRWRAALSAVATQPLLNRVYTGLQAQYAAGIRQYGVVVPRPTVVGLRNGRATVLDCQDASKSGEIDVDTGLPRTVGSARTHVAATLIRCADGRWRVSDARYLDEPC